MSLLAAAADDDDNEPRGRRSQTKAKDVLDDCVEHDLHRVRI